MTRIAMIITSLTLVKYRRFRLRQIQHFVYYPTKKTQIILGTNGSGKAQPLSAKVKTPSGWTTMKDIKVGSIVVAKDGSYVPVTGVYPQGLQQTYRITFKDGRSTLATGDHLWKIYCAKKYPIIPEIVDTNEIIRRLNSPRRMESLVWIDLADSEQSEDVNLPVDPYVLGVMLGDGCFTKSSIVVSHPDYEIMTEVNSRLKDGYYTVPRNKSDPNACLAYGLSTGRRPGRYFRHYILDFLRESGLNECKSFQKFIPELYLNASTKQRLELLQGLMDTDGYIDVQSTTSFSTTSERLAYEVQYLVRSLGGLAVIGTKNPHYQYKGELRHGRKAYSVNIRFKKPSDLFKLSKKKERANDNHQYAKTLRLRIESIEPAGYEECQCIAIDHPDHLYVTDDFVVTHNSSLVRELSPLPARPTDYEKGGYKQIEISHQNKKYILTSRFESEGNRFEFICDGKNLNPGYTVTVYRELVKEHFGYTPEIHAVLTGTTSFHTMSVNDRRTWFMNLSEVDYTYALKYFQRLKEKVRDLQGALKLNQARLVQETEKCLSPDKEKELRTETERLHRVLTELIDKRISRHTDPKRLSEIIASVEASVPKALRQTEYAVEELQQYKPHLTKAVLEEKIQEQQRILFANQREVVQLCEQLESFQKELSIANQNSRYSLDEISFRIQDLEDSRTELLSQLKFSFTFEEPELAQSNLASIREVLSELYTELQDSPVCGVSHEEAYQFLAERNQRELRLTLLKKSFEELSDKRREMEIQRDKGEVKCPSCYTLFHVNFEARQYTTLLERYEAVKKQCEDEEISFKQYLETLEEYQLVLHRRKQFNQIRAQFKSLQPYWNFVDETEAIVKSPGQLNRDLHHLAADLERHVRLKQIRTDVQEQIKLKTMLENSKQVDRSKLEQQIQRIESRLLQLRNSTVEAENQQRMFKKQVELQDLIRHHEDSVRTGIGQWTQASQQLLQDRITAVYDEIIRELKLQISHQERSLSQIDLQHGVVKHLQLQQQELTHQLRLAKQAMKALSPTEGLIAKGMMGFINHFLAEVNRFIEKIWLYPLQIQPIRLEDDDVDLDYRFEVKINDDGVSSDVSELSSGMMEVIDLAFVAVSMRYLGLGQFPIFLDEFAAKMDYAHRQSAYRIIDYLIDSNDYSQVYLVSHYQDGYGNLSNAETLVLCDSNVQLPPHLSYNQHVSMI